MKSLTLMGVSSPFPPLSPSPSLPLPSPPLSSPLLSASRFLLRVYLPSTPTCPRLQRSRWTNGSQFCLSSRERYRSSRCSPRHSVSATLCCRCVCVCVCVCVCLCVYVCGCEGCTIFSQMAPKVVCDTVLTLVREGFLQQVLGPALFQVSF